MRHRSLLCLLMATAGAGILAAANYSLVTKFPVGGSPKWDYLTVDGANRRLYLSHESEVDVFDADSGASAGKLQTLQECTESRSHLNPDGASRVTDKPRA